MMAESIFQAMFISVLSTFLKTSFKLCLFAGNLSLSDESDSRRASKMYLVTRAGFSLEKDFERQEYYT